MLKISKQQALTRWDILPDKLKEAIFDEVNADIIWSLGEKNHLSEEKIKQVAGAAGDVLMGFLHSDPNDVAAEMQESAGIPKEVALEIAREIEKKIFTPLKAEIDAVYSPVRPSEPAPVTVANQPPPEPIRKLQMGKIESSKIVPAPFNLPTAEEEKLSELKRVEIQAPTEEPLKPFMLHEERPLFTPSAPAEHPSVTYEPKKDFLRVPQSKPVKVRVSLPNEESEEKPQRVVHYSDLRTKLDDKGIGTGE